MRALIRARNCSVACFRHEAVIVLRQDTPVGVFVSEAHRASPHSLYPHTPSSFASFNYLWSGPLVLFYLLCFTVASSQLSSHLQFFLWVGVSLPSCIYLPPLLSLNRVRNRAMPMCGSVLKVSVLFSSREVCPPIPVYNRARCNPPPPNPLLPTAVRCPRVSLAPTPRRADDFVDSFEHAAQV